MNTFTFNPMGILSMQDRQRLMENKRLCLFCMKMVSDFDVKRCDKCLLMFCDNCTLQPYMGKCDVHNTLEHIFCKVICKSAYECEEKACANKFISRVRRYREWTLGAKE
jgi:hypothetical protein